LATGKYRVNWNFDDWHGYAAERRRLLKATVRNANRAVIIGGDSHDSWAGVIAADEAHWGVEGSYAAGGLDDKSLGKIGAVEFDTPSVSPPGAFEQSFAWCPSELIDRGHVLANPGTLRHARTGRRGFLMISVDKDEFTADFIVTPTVRSRGYTPTCDGSFVVTESPGIDAGLVFTERRCPNFPSRLFTGPADPRFVDWSSGAAAGLGAASSADDRIKQMDETWIFGVFLGAFFVVGFAAGLTWQQGACGDINARGRGDERRPAGCRGRRRNIIRAWRTTNRGTSGSRRLRWGAWVGRGRVDEEAADGCFHLVRRVGRGRRAESDGSRRSAVDPHLFVFHRANESLM
jgi:hypothetical protein